MNEAAGAAVVLLKKVLILTLQILFENDTTDIDVSVVLSETCFLLSIRSIQTGVVIELARAVHACMKRLALTFVALSAIGVEQIAALVGENDRLVVFGKRSGPDQTFVA